MADPWQVVSQTPTQATPPPNPPASGGGDPWQVVSQAPIQQNAAPPQAAPTSGNFLAEQPGTVGMGALKRIKSMAAGLVDMTDA